MSDASPLSVTGARSTPAKATSPTRYLLGAVGWTLFFLALFRVPWIQDQVLIPYARAQQQVAGWWLGLESLPVIVNFSCTGADVMALCLGSVLAFPVAWRRRLVGAAWGLLLVSVINTVRIGSLSTAVDDRRLFDLLHVYVWPAVLIVAVSAYVFLWMRRAQRPVTTTEELPEATVGVESPWSAPATRRFLIWTVALVGVFVLASPTLLETEWLRAAGRAVAWTGGVILGALGLPARVSGHVLTTAHGGFAVTPTCILSPLLPVYYAALLALPATRRRRIALALLGPAIFFALGTFRLLVLALPRALVGNYSFAIHGFNQVALAALLIWVAAGWRIGADAPRAAAVPRQALSAFGVGVAAAILVGGPLAWTIDRLAAMLQTLAGHAGHAFLDGQGAVRMLLPFELGLLAAFFVAVGRRLGWRRGELAVSALVLTVLHLTLRLASGELAAHAGWTPHVRDLRGLSVAVPLAAAALLSRRRWRTDQLSTTARDDSPARPAPS